MRETIRGGLSVLLALFLQGLLAMLTPWTLRPVLLPGVVCLLGLRLGPTTGAGLGIFAGLLWIFLGYGYLPLALLPALGGLTGSFTAGPEPLPRRWLLCLPGLALYAGIQFLLHLGGGVSVRLLGTSFLISLACLPLAELLCALCFWKKGHGV